MDEVTCADCALVMIGWRRWRRMTEAERAGLVCHRSGGLCRRCDYSANHSRSRGTRADLIEDIMDLLEQEPTTTLEGLALRLGRSRDSITLALRRAARDGDALAIAVRSRLPIRKDIAA